MKAKPEDPPHIKRVFDIRRKLIEVRAEMDYPRSEALETAAGSLTCTICYLADYIEALRRWHGEQNATS